MNLSAIIPDLAALLKDSAQNTILFWLYAVGFMVRHLPDNWIPNNYIPSVICCASVVITPFYVTPFRDAFVMSGIYAVIAIVGYEAVGRRLEGWIKDKIDMVFGKEVEPKVEDRSFKDK